MGQFNKSNVAVWLKEARAARGYTQQELSELAGVSLRSVQRIENGEVVPREYTIRILAEKLGTWPVRNPIEVNNTEPLQAIDTPAPPSARLNRHQKIILSVGSALILILGTCAFIIQSAHFPETTFEKLLLWMGVTAVYTLILYRLWRQAK